MSNRELIRMTLVGLGPEATAKIKALAERQVREFDGSPEMAAEFEEAQKYLEIIGDIEREAGVDG